MNNFQVEFYYTSQNPRHLQQVQLLERVVHETRRAGISFLLTLVNCDDPAETSCAQLPAIPCLRRIHPRPERFIMAPLDTFADIARALGLPSHVQNLNAVGLDIFQGHPGAIPPPGPQVEQ